MVRRLIVGMSGASGAIYGIRLLQVLKDVADVETHLVMSHAAKRTALLETDIPIKHIEALADAVYNFKDIAARISSGSFKTSGMVILPCSIKTLSGVVHAYSDNLLLRAADVVLKDRRRLVLGLRETPLHLGHARLITAVTEMGAIVAPPMPAFTTVHKPLMIS
jgi:4-hydroxy-3-polyprenylbenzoate decarboxylase